MLCLNVSRSVQSGQGPPENVAEQYVNTVNTVDAPRRGVPESPGSYVKRMQRTLVRMQLEPVGNNESTTNSNTNSCNGSEAHDSSEETHVEAWQQPPLCQELPPQELQQQPQPEVLDPPAPRQSPQGRDLETDLMIAALSAMIAMAIPECARLALWLVCVAVSVVVPLRHWIVTAISVFDGRAADLEVKGDELEPLAPASDVGDSVSGGSREETQVNGRSESLGQIPAGLKTEETGGDADGDNERYRQVRLLWSLV